MMNELVSVIVPCYNVEQYVQRTISSTLKQTYANIEVICVDDGSKDNTLQAIFSMAAIDSRVKVFHKENEGVTRARKYGFEHANGEYIGFLDADDKIEPTMFEKLYGNLKKYNADISHCGHDVVWLNGKKENFYGTGRLAQQDKISGLKSLISGSIEPSLCNKLYKHNLLQKLFHSGVMDYSIKTYEDLLMNYYLFREVETTIHEDVCLYHYLKRNGSASSSKINRNHIWDQIHVKQIILKDSLNTDYETEARRSYLLTCIHQYNSIIDSRKAEFETDQKVIQELIRNSKLDFSLLNKKYRSLAMMIINTPRLYKTVYKSLT